MTMRERDISQLLAEREGGECEVRTPAGSIDVLTDKYVYEVKVARQWKAALGQVLAYARAYPDRKPRLYLFGELGGMTKKAIEEHCRAAGVGVVWHRDEDAPPRMPRVVAPPADAMAMQLTAIDASYGIRSTTTFRLPTPRAPIAPAALEAYTDEALAVFDALDNALTITVSAAFGGERQVATRTRESILGDPVCYQLRLTLPTAQGYTFSAGLAGVRKRVFSLQRLGDKIYSMNHGQQNLLQIAALEALIIHPQFPWTSVMGDPATGIERAIFRNYGIKQGKNGPCIGR